MTNPSRGSWKLVTFSTRRTDGSAGDLETCKAVMLAAAGSDDMSWQSCVSNDARKNMSRELMYLQ
jgi:hypothetical protein